MDTKHSALFVAVGVMVGLTPLFITLHVLSDLKTSQQNQYLQRQTRDLKSDREHDRNSFKMFDQSESRYAHRSRQQHAQSKKNKDSAQVQNDLENLPSLQGLGFMRKLFVAVMSDESRAENVQTAVGMTWGSDVIDFKVMYTPHGSGEELTSTRSQHSKEDFIPVEGHDMSDEADWLQGLQDSCQNLEKDYRWYMVTPDNVYINTEPMLAFLDSLYHAESLMLGKSREGRCSLDQGVILSNEAHRRFCENFKQCAAKQSIEQCLAEATGTECIDLAEASGTTYIDDTTVKNRATIKLEKSILLYPTMETPQDFYQIHLQWVDKKIAATTEKLVTLRKSSGNPMTLKTPEEPTAFLNDLGDKIDKHALNSTRPSHQMIEVNGALIRSDCQKAQLVNSIPYRVAKQYADDTMDAVDEPLKTFGYRQEVTASQMVHEFYYTSPEMGRQHVSYITVSQNYSILNMLSSVVHSAKNMSMFTTISDQEDVIALYGYLDNINSACDNISNFGAKCNVFVLVNVSTASVANISQVENIVKGFTTHKRAQNILGLTIKVLSVDSNSSLDASFFGDISQSSIISHTMVYSKIRPEFLLRCQLNSQQKSSLYLPIPFKSYKTHPSPANSFTSNDGYWLTHNLKTFCISQATAENLSLDLLDLIQESGMENLSIQKVRFIDTGISILYTSKQ